MQAYKKKMNIEKESLLDNDDLSLTGSNGVILLASASKSIEKVDHNTAAINVKKHSYGLLTEEVSELRNQFGWNELPEKIIPKWYIFVSQLWQPMPIMIWIAALVEAGIQNWLDMAILLFIQFANASIGYYEITKAGDAVAALKSQLQAKATVKRDGVWINVEAREIVPG
jgi:magnesium-transporting ATPase (P-type)